MPFRRIASHLTFASLRSKFVAPILAWTIVARNGRPMLLTAMPKGLEMLDDYVKHGTGLPAHLKPYTRMVSDVLNRQN